MKKISLLFIATMLVISSAFSQRGRKGNSSDFYTIIGEVLKNGSRPWVWSDYYWHHPDLFLKFMPKSVLQSNWHYGESFDANIPFVKAFLDLQKYGYDQIPTGSNAEKSEVCFFNMVQFCEKNISDSKLLGYFQTFWKPTTEKYREPIFKGIQVAADAIKAV